MCGIAGYFNSQTDKNLLKSMISQINHRGPDGFGYYVDSKNGAGLAHARLSIIDIDGGAQPIHNEDKTIWVTFNGEIYNYKELRTALKKKGHVFYTNTDTEVIVHAYEQYGKEFASYLNGQFAIAIWDENTKTAILVRDRVGIQPLFYTRDKRATYFASEIKSLLVHPSVRNGLNEKQLSSVFTYWSTSPGLTVFQNIYEVESGSMIIIRNGDIEYNDYWDHTYDEVKNADDVVYLENLLYESVEMRLNADVPVASYLSGGIDSTLIAALASKIHGDNLRTFSIKFEDEQYDESGYQQQAIDMLKVNHTNFTCTKDDIADAFQKVIYHTEKPIFRTAPIPMYLLSKMVKENGYKVVLTGEGADEVFGGYDIFRENYVRRLMMTNPESERIPELLSNLYPWMSTDQLSRSMGSLQSFFGSILNDSFYFSHEPRWKTSSKSHMFFESLPPSNWENLTPYNACSGSPLQQAQYLEFKTLFSGYLISSQGDRMLMANGVEGRFPFLDPRVVDFGNTLPDHRKVFDGDGGLVEKHIIKQVAGDYVQESIINRCKQPYMAPDADCFFNGDNEHDYLKDMLSEEMLTKYGFFNAKKVGILRKKFALGKAKGFPENMALVGILSTQSLQDAFVDNLQLKPTVDNNKFDISVEKY